jgi:hypothetical protein
MIATTMTRIYQFVGSLSGRREEEGGMLEAAFHQYSTGDVQPSGFEMDVEEGEKAADLFASGLQSRWNCLASRSTRSCTSSHRYEPTRRGRLPASRYQRVSRGLLV